MTPTSVFFAFACHCYTPIWPLIVAVLVHNWPTIPLAVVAPYPVSIWCWGAGCGAGVPGAVKKPLEANDQGLQEGPWVLAQ
jgi:hypothetical protein